MLNNKKQIYYNQQKINKNFTYNLPQISKILYIQALSLNINNLNIILQNNKIKIFRATFINNIYKTFLFNKLSIKTNKNLFFLANISFLQRLYKKNILYPSFFISFKKKKIITTSLGYTSLQSRNNTKDIKIKIKKKRFSINFFYKFYTFSHM
jgi:hypothetical protein